MGNLNENSTDYVHSYEPNTNDLTMAMDYNAAGEPIIRTINDTFNQVINVALGDTYTQVFKHGFNSNFQNNVLESFWGGSNLYPWSAWNTTGTLSLVSTSGSDNGSVTIRGLDTNFDQQTDTVSITGLTPVTTTTTWARVHEISYTDGVANAGAVTASRGGTVIAQIPATFGTSQMSQYTIPAGYTGFVWQGLANIGKGNDGTGRFVYRPYGSTWQVGFIFLLYESTFQYKFTTPFVLPEKTDIDVQLTASNTGTAAGCAYDLILVANEDLA